MNEPSQTSHSASEKSLVAVWAALITLTGLTIGAAELDFGRLGMVINLLIASTKASLVIWIFMHLKYEKRIFKLLLIIPVIVLTVAIGLTMVDVRFR